jgi:hypothetical protein
MQLFLMRTFLNNGDYYVRRQHTVLTNGTEQFITAIGTVDETIAPCKDFDTLLLIQTRHLRLIVVTVCWNHRPVYQWESVETHRLFIAQFVNSFSYNTQLYIKKRMHNIATVFHHCHWFNCESKYSNSCIELNITNFLTVIYMNIFSKLL